MRSGVRIRKLLTRASGTPLASRLRRNIFLGFWEVTCGHGKPSWPIFGPLGLSWPIFGAFLVKLWGVVGQIVGRFWSNC